MCRYNSILYCYVEFHKIQLSELRACNTQGSLKEKKCGKSLFDTEITDDNFVQQYKAKRSNNPTSCYHWVNVIYRRSIHVVRGKINTI